jgi:hypothetical protein
MEFVGKEVLPNAYVKSIEINQSGKDSFSLTIKTNVFDFVDDAGETSWFDPSNAITKAMTKLVASHVPEDYQFVHTFTKEFPIATQDLAIFVFCFMKPTETFQLAGVQAPEVIGPIKSEKILERQKPASRTTIFRKPDGSLYSGPVHETADGQFMEGARHTNQTHATLSKQIITNFKIKDKRETLQTKIESESTNLQGFSELFSSYDDNTNINCMFFMNQEAVLKTNTKFGKFLSRASQAVLQALLQQFRIKTFNIQRLRLKTNMRSGAFKTKKEVKDIVFSKKNIVKSYDGEGKLMNHTRLERRFSFDVVEEELPSNSSVAVPSKQQIYREQVNNYKKISKVRELFFDYDRRLRCFEFVDLELTDKTPGKYQYKVDITFFDPTYKFLENITSTMKQGISDIKNYQGFLSRPANYNFARSESKIVSYPAADLSALVETYVTFYSYIYRVNTLERQRMSLQLYSLINPSSATVSSVNKFSEKFNNLYSEFLFFFDQKSNRSHFNSINSYPRRSGQTSLIMATNEFKEIFEPSKNYTAAGYFAQQKRQGMKLFSKREIAENAEKEQSKHYSGALSTSSPAINNLRKGFLKHWSPVYMRSGQDKADSTKANPIDTKVFNLVTKGVTNKKKRKSLGFSVVPKKEKNSETNVVESGERFVESREILGSGHEIVSYSNAVEPFKVPVAIAKASNVFENTINELTETKRTKRDLDKKALEMQESERDQLPMQIKAILARNDQNTKNILNTVRTDLLANSETKDYYEINNFSVQKMSFLDGFEKDSENNILLNKPLYVEMSADTFNNLNRSVVGSLDPYTNNRLSIDGNLNISTMDSFFILSDNDIELIPPQETIGQVGSSYANTEITYQYTDSNIVVQPLISYDPAIVAETIRATEDTEEFERIERLQETPAVAQLEPFVKFINESDSENRVKIYLSLKYGFKSQDFIPIEVGEQSILDGKPKNSEGKYNFEYSKEEGKFEVFRLRSRPKSYQDFQNNKILDVRNRRSSTAVVFYDPILPGRKYYYMFRALNLEEVPSNPTPVYEVELIKLSSGSRIEVKIVNFDEKKTIYHDKNFKNLLQIKPAFQQEVFNDQAPEVLALDSFKQKVDMLTLGTATDKVWGKKFKIRIKSKDTGKIIDLNVKFNLNKEKRPEDF